MGTYFFLNGEILRAEKAQLRITDLALLRGFGIFDFCRTHNGIPLLIENYLERFYNSARFVDLEIPYTKEKIRDTISELLKRNGIKESGIRMVLTGGYTENGYLPGEPNFFILIEKIHYPSDTLYDHGIKLMLHEHQRELSHIKSINYLTPLSIRNKTVKNEAYDVLYYNKGQVLEVSRSNIFIVKDDILVTPDKNILRGITRATVIKLASEFYTLEERQVSLEELFLADEVFMTGTTKKVLPVRQIDQHIIGSGKPGPVTKKLQSTYREFEDQYITFSDPAGQG